MSWHCVSVRGANGDATPYCLASASTCRAIRRRVRLARRRRQRRERADRGREVDARRIFPRHRSGVAAASAATTATSTAPPRLRRRSCGAAATTSTASSGLSDTEHLRERVDRRRAARRVGRRRLGVDARAWREPRRTWRARAFAAVSAGDAPCALRREQTIQVARRRIGEDRRRAHDRGLLRMRERNLDDFDAEVRVVRVPGVVVAARQLVGRTNARRARDVDVDVVRCPSDRRTTVCVCDPRQVCTFARYFGLSMSVMSKMRRPRMRSLLTGAVGACVPQSRRAVGASADTKSKFL